jgi:hypothetical protein
MQRVSAGNLRRGCANTTRQATRVVGAGGQAARCRRPLQRAAALSSRPAIPTIGNLQAGVLQQVTDIADGELELELRDVKVCAPLCACGRGWQCRSLAMR